ncbi:MAG: hypothetical protein ACRDOK_18480, partial [Streptosporangiaceae bacterium]
MALPQLRGQRARRLGWGVADQAVSSLTNFALVIYVARTLGAAQLGAFSLAYVTYGFALNASRGLATAPLQVRFAGVDLPTWRRAVASCTGTATVVGLASGVCALAAAALLHGATGVSFLALGLTLPGLLLQDSWRYSFFALGRGGQAFLSDVVWAGALVPTLMVLHITHHGSLFWLVLAWGATATLAAAVGPLQARVIPRLSGTKGWLSQQRDLGPRYLVEGTSQNASEQLRTYDRSLMLGLAAVGYLRTATTLMGPFQVILYSSSLVLVPEAARILRRSPRRLPLVCLLMSGGLAVAGLAWGVVLLVALPRGIGGLLLGPIWRPTYPLLLPTTLLIMAQAVNAGAAAGLHALGAARRSLPAGVFASCASLVGAVVGAAEGGAVGTVNGSTVGTVVAGLFWWWQLRAALRESGVRRDHNWFGFQRPPGRHRSPAVVG